MTYSEKSEPRCESQQKLICDCVDECKFEKPSIWRQFIVSFLGRLAFAIFTLIVGASPFVIAGAERGTTYEREVRDANGLGVVVARFKGGLARVVPGADYEELAEVVVEKLREEGLTCNCCHHDGYEGGRGAGGLSVTPGQSKAAGQVRGVGTLPGGTPPDGAAAEATAGEAYSAQPGALTHQNRKRPEYSDYPHKKHHKDCCCCCHPKGKPEGIVKRPPPLRGGQSDQRDNGGKGDPIDDPQGGIDIGSGPGIEPDGEPRISPAPPLQLNTRILIETGSLVRADSGRWPLCNRQGYRFSYFKDKDGRGPEVADWDPATSKYRDLSFFDLDRLFPQADVGFSCTSAINQGMWKDEASKPYDGTASWPEVARLIYEFEALDKNNTNTLSRSELKDAAGAFIYGLTEAWFVKIDTDNSRGMSVSELEPWVKEPNGYLSFVSSPNDDTPFMGVHVTFLRDFDGAAPAEPTPAKVSIPVTSSLGRKATSSGTIDLVSNIRFQPGDPLNQSKLAPLAGNLSPSVQDSRYAFVEFDVVEDANQLIIGECSFVDAGGPGLPPSPCGSTRTVQNVGGTYRVYLDETLKPTWVAKVDEP